MNWGAVLFLCALVPRVCGPAGKNGGVSIGTPPFFGESPQFFLCGSPFFVRGGECAVRSVERCAVSRPPREDRCRSGLPIGAAGAQKRRGVEKYAR